MRSDYSLSIFNRTLDVNLKPVEKTYTINEENGNLTIELNPRKPASILFGLAALAVFYAFTAFLYIYLLHGSPPSMSDIGSWLIPLIILLVYTGFYLLISRAFIRRLSQYEIVTVTGKTLTITDKSILSKEIKRFDLAHVREIYFAGTENFTKHPLDGNYSDIGFRGMEGVVQYQIQGGTIELLYIGQQIRFGRNIPSWDVEDVIKAIEKFTGRSFNPEKTVVKEPEVKKYRGGM
ncbi:MAG: hypothetical protein JWO03_3106 [Bacteroidetes bacterium]|nr:hypothetical protein [Bacteroidota bacterium]